MVARYLLLLIVFSTSSCTQRNQQIATFEGDEPVVDTNANEREEMQSTKLPVQPVFADPPEDIVTIDAKNGPAFYPRMPGSGKGGGASRRARCGDKHVQKSEQCDDGNTLNNDGCSSTCTKEEGFPLCSWACDDPVCPAACEPVCDQPKCDTLCEALPSTPNCDCEVTCEKPNCSVRCPEEHCELEHCPACETVCAPPICATHCVQIDPTGPSCENPLPNCETLCEPIKCAWKCFKPTCPEPRCELQCESPLTNCEETL